MMNRYLLTLGITTLIALTGFAALNTVVDPFGLWELRRSEGINHYKPAFTRGMQPVKPHVVKRRQPQVLILGSSRVGEGLSCAMLAAPSCYNGAFPGGSLYEASRLIGQTSGRTHSIYLGLDFEAAIKPDVRAPGFSERRFSRDPQQQPNPVYPWQLVVDYYSLSLTADTSLGSLRTLWRQAAERNPVFSRSLDPDGSWDLRTVAASETVAAAQQARVFRLIRRYSDNILSAQSKAGEDVLAARMDAWFTLLQGIIESSRNRGTELQLFINPSHALYHDALHQSGTTPLFMDWLRRLQSLEQAYAGFLPPVWNFADYDRYSSSELPGRKLNLWFNDPVHYSRRLGELLLRQMRGECGDSGPGRCLRNQDLVQFSSRFLAAGSSYSEQLQASGFLTKAKPGAGAGA